MSVYYCYEHAEEVGTYADHIKYKHDGIPVNLQYKPQPEWIENWEQLELPLDWSI